MAPRLFRIVVADDIPLMRLMLSKYARSAAGAILEPTLGPVAIKVLEAGDGEETSRILRQHEVDLLFLDLMMPRKDGLEVLREIRNEPRQRNLTVVVCSAIGDRDVIEKAMGLGARAYIVKPFTLNAVEERLQALYGTPSPAGSPQGA